MKVRVFTLPWRPEGGFDDAEVQEFLEGRTALEVSQHFFVHEKTPVLVLVVTWREGAPRPRPSHRDSGQAPSRDADTVPDLTGEELCRYEALRSWRNQYARRVGRPPSRRAQGAPLAPERVGGLDDTRVSSMGRGGGQAPGCRGVRTRGPLGRCP